MVDYPLPPPPVLRRCVTQLGLPDTAPINWELLDQALIHSSASAQRNNERLEFLGDAVLRLAAAEFLMEQYPGALVGELSALRSHLVSDQTLTRIAEKLGIEPFLKLSPAAAGDAAARPTRLADAVEAILAVLYLSTGDLQLVRPWLDPYLITLAAQLSQNPEQHNPKTALQELIQKHYKTLPEYRTTEVSMTHGDPERFRAEVWFRDRCLGTGVGASRKLAEQAAALAGYKDMQAIVLAKASGTH
ncbi:MAG: ribonuclease III [Leptolyngbya sp. SIO1E4]|nr:ribonuclease III [Leptolyngbya sp. SIO1E4]